MLLTQFSILLKKAVLIFVFILSALFSFAQNGTVTGTVKDANGAPLSNASVTVQGSGRGTTTNTEGMFTLSLNPGRYTIVASYVGYGSANKSVDVQNNSTATVDFLLSESGDVTEVVVTGTRALLW